MHLAAAPRHAAAVSAPPAAAGRHKTRLCVTAAAAGRAAVGIDLGTTNSVVAVLREGETRPTVIHTSSSSSGSSFTIPSVVAYQPATHMPLVGAAAKQQAAANPSNSFYSVKRLMGRSWQEAQDLGLLYGLQEAADGSVELVCPAQGKALSPQQVRWARLHTEGFFTPTSPCCPSHLADGNAEMLLVNRTCSHADRTVCWLPSSPCPSASTTTPAHVLQQHTSHSQVSAELLRHLLGLASSHLSGHTPQQVVITVPAYFNTQQRAATLEAAKLAGIHQASLLQEPVAAAMAFGFGKPYDAETLLVFDLGGGTFDLSVVDSFEGIMEVLATGGDALLGGDDFDTVLLHGLLAERGSSHQAGLSSSSGGGGGTSSSSSSLGPDVMAELLAAVESAKCQLSTQECVPVTVSPAAAAAVLGSSQQQQQQDPVAAVQLTRQRMHELTAGLRQKLWQPLQPLADACKLQYACSPSSIEQQLQGRQQSAVGSNSSNGSNGSSADPYAPKPRQLTAVLLVGGATRMPIIQQGLQVLTGLQPR